MDATVEEGHSGHSSGDYRLESESRRIPFASGIDITQDEILFGEGAEGIIISSGEGEILEVNAAAERLLDRPRAEIFASGMNAIFSDVRLKKALASDLQDKDFRGKFRLSRGSDASFEAQVGVVNVGDGKVGFIFQEADEGVEVSGETEVEGFFKALVENRTGVVILAGDDGAIRYASPSLEEILGSEPEEVIGGGLEDRVHPEDREKVSETFGEPGKRVSGVFRLRHGGGGWIEIEGSVENLLTDREINGVAFVGRKVNSSSVESPAEGGYEEKLKGMVERLAESERRLAESEKLFRTTFDEAPVGIAHVGIDGRWIRTNKKLCELTGYTRRELLGRTFQDITHTDDLGMQVGVLQTMTDGERNLVSFEKRYVKKDFTHVWASVSASLVRDDDGKPQYFIFTVEDITGAREAQQISRSLNDRETKVLALLGRGMTNREIAAEMNFSLSSAKVYVGRVISKLGAADRTNAAVKAANLGILSHDD